MSRQAKHKHHHAPTSPAAAGFWRDYPRFLTRAVWQAFDGSWAFYLWMTVLTAIALVGANAWAVQVRDGMAVTGMTDHVSWGLYIANFTFLVGLAAGGGEESAGFAGGVQLLATEQAQQAAGYSGPLTQRDMPVSTPGLLMRMWSGSTGGTGSEEEAADGPSSIDTLTVMVIDPTKQAASPLNPPTSDAWTLLTFSNTDRKSVV